MANISLQLEQTLTPYVTALLAGLPPVIKLPLLEYGSIGGCGGRGRWKVPQFLSPTLPLAPPTSGVFGFYAPQLKDVMSYSELQTEVFHSFREIGNAVIIFHLFEDMLVREGEREK